MVLGKPAGLFKEAFLYAGTDWSSSSVSQRVAKGHFFRSSWLTSEYVLAKKPFLPQKDVTENNTLSLSLCLSVSLSVSLCLFVCLSLVQLDLLMLFSFCTIGPLVVIINKPALALYAV